MGRIQVGLRISEAAVAKIDLLASECKRTRADAHRALLAEALATQSVVTGARKRLQQVEL